MASSSFNLVPELELVIGKQPPGRGPAAQTRRTDSRWFFRRFSGSSRAREHPLALFLDDLQWLDAATLGPPRASGYAPSEGAGTCCLAGAYRDNEVSPAHPLLRTLESDPVRRRPIFPARLFA